MAGNIPEARYQAQISASQREDNLLCQITYDFSYDHYSTYQCHETRK